MDHSRIVRIAVVGAGLMGHGIAQEFALAGYQVRLHDLSDDRLRTALTDIRANLLRLSSMGRLESPDRPGARGDHREHRSWENRRRGGAGH